jgi:TRAP-type C4-dicarboxylate transport system permease small subunit
MQFIELLAADAKRLAVFADEVMWEREGTPMEILRLCGRLFDRLLDILIVLAIAILIFGWLSVCFEVIMRYFAGQPQIWVIETVEYILLYICFLGAAWLLREEGHVKVDVLLNWLSPKNQALVNTITSGLATILWLIFTWYSGGTTLKALQKELYTATILEIPKAPLYAIMPVGSFLLCVQFLRRTYGYMMNYKQH